MRVWLQCGKTYCAAFCASLPTGQGVAMPVERMTGCFKHRKDVAWLVSLYLDMYAFFRYFTVKKTRRLLPAEWLSCLILSGLLISMQYIEEL